MLAEKINKARQAGFSDDEIVSVLGETDASLAGKIGKAREAGFGLNEILTELSGGPKERDSAFDPGYLGKQFAAGAAGTITGKGQTLKVLGAEGAGDSLETVGRSLTPEVQSASDRFRNPRMGDSTVLGYGVGSVPGMVAEGLGSFAGELPSRAAGAAAGGIIGGALGSVVPGAGTAAGAALGSTIGGYAGPLVSSALTRFGPEVLQRQQKNDGQLSGSDYAVAAGSSLAQGALESLGMGKVLGTASQAGSRALGETVKQAGKSAVAEGATEAGQNAISEVATNIGTKRSDLSVGNVIDAAVTGAVGGAGTGGTIRVAGDATRKAGDVIGNRGYSHPEELPNIAAGLQNIADGEKLKLGNRYDSAQVVDKYDQFLETSSKNANKGVEARLKQLQADGVITTEDMNKAIASLTKPTQEGFDIIQRHVGDIAEGVDAIQLAKQKATLGQLKKRAGLDRNPNKVTGGLTGVAERMIRSATNNLLGAGLGAGAVLTGYKGLGTLGASAAAVGGAAPMAALISGAALAPLALDKVMGTYDPVQNLVQNKISPDGVARRAGEGLPSLAQTKVAEAQARQAENDQAKRMAQEAKVAKGVNNLMAKRAKSYQFDEQGFLDKVENAATNELIVENTARVSNERQAANLAMRLAEVQQKLDLARNIVKPASEYAAIATLRDDPKVIQSYIDKATNDLKAEGIAKREATATKKGAKAQPTAQPQATQAGGQEAQAQAQGTGVLSGLTQSASDTTAPASEVNPKVAKSIQNKARIFTSFRKRVEQLDNAPEGLLADFQTLNGDINNYNDGKKFVNRMIKQYPEQADFIRTFWLSDLDKPSIKQNLAKLFVYNDGDGNKIIMTRKEADKRSGR